MTIQDEVKEQLKGTITLLSPIEINGKEIKSLSYDLMKIDEELLSKADSLSHAGKKFSDVTLEEADYTYHRYLGMAAIIAENPWIDWEDLKRIKGIDLRTLTGIGHDFFISPGVSDEEISDEQPEPTAGISTQA